MVSPLGSLVAGLGPQTNAAAQIGDIFRQSRVTNSNLESADLQRQAMTQNIGMQQENQAAQRKQLGQQEALQAATYVNKLGKRLLATDESQWSQILQPQLPALQALGYDPRQLAGMTREQVQSVVAQTDPIVQMGQGQSMVRSTENLPGGLTKTVMSDGTVRITNAAGETLQGAEAAKAVEDARKLGIETERQTYGARESGKLDEQLDKKALLEERITRAKENAKNATGQIKKYFGQLGNIQSNIANYNEAINLIDQGADTGVIASRLPSVRAASQKLDNVQNRLGLDVVGNTTFGALSESELAFAVNTALPTNLEGEELKAWLIQKRDAQEKLASYIDNAIQFLNIEGNDLADLQAMNPRQNVNTPSQQQAPAAGQTPPGGVKFLGFE